MAKSISLTYLSFLFSPSRVTISSSTFLSHSLFPSRTFSFSPRLLSTTRTPYPLQYELIINRPPPPSQTRPPPVRPNDSLSKTTFPEPDDPDEPTSELKLDSWVDLKLASETAQPGSTKLEQLDKAKRKYYNKRRKRMYGSDSEDENRRPDEKFVELKPEVVEFPTLHRREEELYFYDAFTYPWEKDKHYKMVYQLEKKYFPDQCLDKAFLEPGQQQSNEAANSKKKGVKREKKDDENKFVFFEGKEKGDSDGSNKGLTEKKVGEFFKGLRKVPNKDGVQVGDANGGEPFFSSRRTGPPPVWDGPHGTVLLVNKPKGEFEKN